MRHCQACLVLKTVPVLMAGILLTVGCSKEDPAPVAAAPVAEKPVPTAPEAFPITSTDVVVEEADIPDVAMQKRVEADFNQDNLEDIAVVEEDRSGTSTVSIYLQKKTDDNLERAFYKAGGIRMSGEFTVTALMSKSKSDHTDLIVIQLYNDARKEMVHFRTRGTDFTEVERVPIN